MNDITKARAFLHATSSDLQHLVSFGLMLATAESRYREIGLKKKLNAEGAGLLDAREIESLLEVAVLRYLKRTNKLPPNVTDAFTNNPPAEKKYELALSWMNG